MKLWIAIVVLMFATVGHAGKAEAAGFFYTGSVLLERCESDSPADLNTCYGYLAGINDITLTYDDWGDMTEGFCVPDGVRASQLSKVVIKGLNERPEKLHKDASSLVANIFYEAFPCD